VECDMFFRRWIWGNRMDNDTRAECTACGVSLDPHTAEPCPNCGRTDTKRVHKTVVTQVATTGAVSARETGGNTGRSAQVLLDSKRTYHVSVQRFVEDLCKKRRRPNWWSVLLSRRVAWRLFVELGRAVSTGIDASYYRSRRFPADAPAPTSSDFGPPPLAKQDEGRYTNGKQVVLYLSRTPKVAALEKPLQDSSESKLYIQEFHLLIPEFKFLRLTQDLESKATSLQYFLLESEYLPEESSFDPYRPTQFLAFLCGLRGILAVEYPSVRAGYKDDPDAVNLVVIGPAVDAIKRMTRSDPLEYPLQKTEVADFCSWHPLRERLGEGDGRTGATRLG